MQRSPQDPGGGGDQFRNFNQRAPQPSQGTKNVYFYKDGDTRYPAIKMVVNKHKYRTFDKLLDELTGKFSMLPFGCRSIYTPQGHNNISSLEQLSDQGKYVCSSQNKAKGVDVLKVHSRQPWHGGGKSGSGRGTFADQVRAARSGQNGAGQGKYVSRQAWGGNSTSPRSNGTVTRTPKKITVLKNGDHSNMHTLLLNRQTHQLFENVLKDLSDMFYLPIKKLYTTDGRRVSEFASSIQHFPQFGHGI